MSVRTIYSLAKTYAADGRLDAKEADDLRVAAQDGIGLTLGEHKALARVAEKYETISTRAAVTSLQTSLALPIVVSNKRKLSAAYVDSATLQDGPRPSVKLSGNLPDPAHALSYSVEKRDGTVVITVGSQRSHNNGTKMVLKPFDAELEIPFGGTGPQEVKVVDTRGQLLVEGPVTRAYYSRR